VEAAILRLPAAFAASLGMASQLNATLKEIGTGVGQMQVGLGSSTRTQDVASSVTDVQNDLMDRWEQMYGTRDIPIEQKRIQNNAMIAQGLQPIWPDIMHEGGVVGVPEAHTGMFMSSSMATDEIPIIAQTGEAFLSRDAVSMLGGQNFVDAANTGGGVLQQYLATHGGGFTGGMQMGGYAPITDGMLPPSIMQIPSQIQQIPTRVAGVVSDVVSDVMSRVDWPMNLPQLQTDGSYSMPDASEITEMIQQVQDAFSAAQTSTDASDARFANLAQEAQSLINEANAANNELIQRDWDRGARVDSILEAIRAQQEQEAQRDQSPRSVTINIPITVEGTILTTPRELQLLVGRAFVKSVQEDAEVRSAFRDAVRDLPEV